MRRNSFSMFSWKRLIPVAFFVMFSFTIQVSGMSVAIAAKTTNDPKVIIAVDETPSSCATIKTISSLTHKQISRTRTKCAPGTLIGTAAVTLLQAKAHREAYIPSLSLGASPNSLKSWYGQVKQLEMAKRKALQPLHSPNIISPASCGYYGKYYAGYYIILNDYVAAEADYYITNDCRTIYWDTASLSAGYVPYNNPVWWIGVAYANYFNVCGGFPVHLLYPNSSYVMYPNTSQSAGYYAVFDLDSGNLCGFQGGALRYLNVGPISG